MRKNVWCYLSVIQTAMILILIGVLLWQTFSETTAEKADLKAFLDEHESVGYLPQAGYIPDAKTAGTIGSAIIDKMSEESVFRPDSVTVEYDEENRLWLISKNYFYGFFAFGPGGVVVIEQDSGKIVKAFLTK